MRAKAPRWEFSLPWHSPIIMAGVPASLDRSEVVNLRRGVEGHTESKVEVFWGNVEGREQTERCMD